MNAASIHPAAGHRRSRRRLLATISVTLAALLALPGGALSAEPTDPSSGGAPVVGSEATAEPSAAAPSTTTPSEVSPEPVTAEPTDAPSASPTLEPVPTETATASPSPTPDGSTIEPPASASPTATSTPRATPTATATPRAVALSTATPIRGYRWTDQSTRLYDRPSTRGVVRANLPADARLTVSESVSNEGTTWVKGRTDTGVVGYVVNGALRAYSPLHQQSQYRYTIRPTALYGGVGFGEAKVRSLPPSLTIYSSSWRWDHLGRKWMWSRATLSGVDYRGYLPYWHTSTTPVSRSGTWTVFVDSTLYRYAWSGGPRIRTLRDGDRVTRKRAVVDSYGSSWTYVTIGSSSGWVRSPHITGPYRQYVWNGSNPVTEQYTNYWCVPASVQTELNMALNRYSTSYAFQETVYYYGRANLGYPLQSIGLDPQAWSRSLNYFSDGRVDYADTTFGSFTGAMRTGVFRMRRTGLPVGVLVYHGTHAWTMIGYTATADPRKTSKFDITGVYVAAPFQRWTDPPPGTWYSTSAFRDKLTPYYEPERWTRWNGYYTLVIPD